MTIHESKTILGGHHWLEDPAAGNIPIQLIEVINKVFVPLQLTLSAKPCREMESSEYGASSFAMENKNFVFRVAKPTPKKIGQFVTLWKRPANKMKIIPIDLHDSIDIVLVCVYDKFN